MLQRNPSMLYINSEQREGYFDDASGVPAAGGGGGGGGGGGECGEGGGPASAVAEASLGIEQGSSLV